MMNKDDVLNKLKEDYNLRSMLIKKNYDVPDELVDEIEELELSMITSKVIPELERYAKELLLDLECEVCLGVLKDGNGDVRVENEYVDCMPVPFHVDTFETIGISKDDLVYDGEDEPGEPLSGAEPIVISRNNIKDSENHDLRITIDGKVFEEKNSIQTFIKALRYIGLDKVAKVGIICSGYNLIDTRKRTDGKRKWQQQVDGKWIYVYFLNPTKCKYLFDIADYHNLKVRIEAIEK